MVNLLLGDRYILSASTIVRNRRYKVADSLGNNHFSEVCAPRSDRYA